MDIFDPQATVLLRVSATINPPEDVTENGPMIEVPTILAEWIERQLNEIADDIGVEYSVEVVEG